VGGGLPEFWREKDPGKAECLPGNDGKDECANQYGEGKGGLVRHAYVSRLPHESPQLEMGKYIRNAIEIKMGWELTSLAKDSEPGL
jgi:hypothetical protein